MACIIHFSGPINPTSVEKLRNNILDLIINGHADSIRINLSSEGGSLNAAFTAYEFLRSLQVPLCIHNVGSVCSAAIIVYLAAEERLSDPNSTFLIHNFTYTFNHPSVSYPMLKEALASLESDNERYVNIVNSRTEGANVRIDISKCLQGDALTLTANAAIDSGLSTKIVSTDNCTSTSDIHIWTQNCV